MEGAISHNLHTNSCIELSVPHEYHQWGPISFSWFCTGVKVGSSHLAQYLSYQQRGVKNNDQSYYLCSPLDIGCFINVRIEQERQGETIVLEHLKYGPVELEDGLLTSVGAGQWRNIEVVLNKNVRKIGNIEVKSMQFGSQISQKHISITINISNFEFEFNLDEDWAQYQLESFKKEPFFKLFDSEPTAIAIYLSNQLQEFMEKLKVLKVYYHYGHYVKIYFETRACRDVFMLNLLSKINTLIPELHEFKNQFSNIESQFDIQTLHSRPSFPSEHKTDTSKDISKIPKIQSIIRKSQIAGFEFLSSFEAETETPKVQEDILEDIYNILYTPITIVERETIHPEVTITTPKADDKNGDRNLTFSVNFINGSIHQDESSYIQSTNVTKIVDQRDNQDRDLETNYDLTVKKETLLHEVEKKKSLKSNHVILDKNEVGKDHNDRNLIDKINELTKINEELMIENQELRIENSRLKMDSGKNKKAQEINKMIEIKAMVQMMAKKLETLEGGSSRFISNENIFDKIRKKSFQSEEVDEKEKEDKKSQVVKVQSKNVWSPKAHEDIMNSLKWRNPDQGQSKNKSPEFRAVKKKMSDDPKTLENMTNPSNKLNLKTLKECSSAGKLMNSLSWRNNQKEDLKKEKNEEIHKEKKNSDLGLDDPLKIPRSYQHTTFSKESAQNLKFVPESEIRNSIPISPHSIGTQPKELNQGSTNQFRNVFKL